MSWRSLGALLAGALLVPPAATTAVCVNPNKPACEATVQAGVDAAALGETVSVAKGVYRENVTIATDGILLKGPKTAVIDAEVDPNSVPGIRVEANNVALEGLTVRHGNADGIFLAAGAIGTTIRGVTVIRPDQDCIGIAGTANNTTIDRVTLMGCGSDGVDVDPNGVTGLRITASRFDRIANDGINGDMPGAVIEKNRLDAIIESDGIDVDGDDIQILGNRLSGIGSDGIDMEGNGIVITGNRLDAVGDDAIEVDCDPCTKAVVSSNRIAKILDDAFNLDGDGNGLLVEGNRLAGIEDDGIDAGANLSGVIRNNRVKELEDEAIDLDGTDMIVTGNKAIGSAGEGFRVSTIGGLYEKNKAMKGIRNGFDISETDPNAFPELIGNQAKKNLGVGFSVKLDAPDTRLEGNTGKGNALADFCDAGINTQDVNNKFGTEFDPMGGECPVD